MLIYLGDTLPSSYSVHPGRSTLASLFPPFHFLLSAVLYMQPLSGFLVLMRSHDGGFTQKAAIAVICCCIEEADV